MKSTLLDGDMVLNFAFYYLDWSGIQTNVTTPVIATTAGPQQLVFIDGGADARIFGGEVELSYQPSNDVALGFNVNLQDGEFTNVTTSSIVEGTDIPRSPDLNISGFVQYTPELTDTLSGLARFDLQYVGSSLDQPITDGSDLFPIPPALTGLDSYVMARARVGVAGDNWSFDVFVDNLFDDRPVIGISPFFNSFQAGDFAVTTLRPRTFGATARVNY